MSKHGYTLLDNAHTVEVPAPVKNTRSKHYTFDAQTTTSIAVCLATAKCYMLTLDGTVVSIDTESGSITKMDRIKGAWTRIFSVSSSGKTIVAGFPNGSVVLLDIASQTVHTVLMPTSQQPALHALIDGINSNVLVCDQTGNMIAYHASADKSTVYPLIVEGIPVRSYGGCSADVSPVLGQTSKTLVFVTRTPELVICKQNRKDAAQGTTTHPLKHKLPCTGLALSPDEKYVLIVYADLIEIFDTSSNALCQAISTVTCGIPTWTSDGEFVYCSNERKLCKATTHQPLANANTETLGLSIQSVVMHCKSTYNTCMFGANNVFVVQMGKRPVFLDVIPLDTLF